jgi:hypothetical protein
MIKALLFSLCTAIGFSATVCAQISDFQTTDFRKADSIAALYPKHSLSDLSSIDGFAITLKTIISFT